MEKRDTAFLNKRIFEQLNRLLIAKSEQGGLIHHNLEKGLGNEQIFRDLLKEFLPNKYGIAKGKIINYFGDASKQCDLIIYDQNNCPRLFIDENENQIIPIEGVYCVIQIKTTLNRSTMKQSFENLMSVYEIGGRQNLSKNIKLTICPPDLRILAYQDGRSLEKIARDYRDLNSDYEVNSSFVSYSKKSPGYQDYNGKKYLVSTVDVLNKGSIFQNYDGSVSYGDWGEFTLGLSLINLVECLNEIKLKSVNLTNYLNINDFSEETIITLD